MGWHFLKKLFIITPHLNNPLKKFHPKLQETMETCIVSHSVLTFFAVFEVDKNFMDTLYNNFSFIFLFYISKTQVLVQVYRYLNIKFLLLSSSFKITESLEQLNPITQIWESNNELCSFIHQPATQRKKSTYRFPLIYRRCWFY